MYFRSLVLYTMRSLMVNKSMDEQWFQFLHIICVFDNLLVNYPVDLIHVHTMTLDTICSLVVTKAFDEHKFLFFARHAVFEILLGKLVNRFDTLPSSDSRNDMFVGDN